ncbi:MAG: lysylphosphatidylglycerol synthase transmembrane domain-containing protein [Kineosporiaceae bacterium]
MTADGTGRAPRRSLRSAARAVLWRGVLLLLVLLVVEYFVVPRLVGASKDFNLLSRVHPAWLVVGVGLEAAALLSYALLSRTLLPRGGPGLFRLFQIMMSTMALGHVAPGGVVTGPGLGFQLLTAEGVSAGDAAFVLASQAIGSAVVLNALLWVTLLASLPLAGYHPVYLTVAALGLAAIAATTALVYTFSRGEERAVRIVRSIGRRIPRMGADRLEHAVRSIGESLAHLGRHRDLLRAGTLWAALNWLLDAAALWAFLAAFGRAVEPVELFVAYGVAMVLAVLPIVPAGLGIVEATSISLLVSFGVPAGVATFGVLTWRLVSFWLPIPLGAAAYVALRMRHRPNHRLDDPLGRSAR